MTQPVTHSLDAHMLRRIAVIATCDPRSVVRYLTGHGPRMRPTARTRIERALRRLHINVNMEGSTTST